MTTLSKQFYALFRGSDLAHGKSSLLSKTTQAGKQETRSWTVKQPATVEEWTAHLEGRQGLGIIPINEHNNCKWGAIDIDIYGCDPMEIARQVIEAKLPLTPILSKSGGVHLYLFLSEWVPAKLVCDKLDAFAATLGYATAEIFPKQSTVHHDAEAPDFGNWINMPYFGGDKRHAITEKFEVLSSPTEFLTYIESRRLSRSALENFKTAVEANDILPDGPPCLNLLYSQPNHEGYRNELIANTIVYLKKVYPDDWKTKLDEYNLRLSTPLGSAELQNTIKSYSGTDYRYKCQQQPLKSFCNSSECKKRKFGINEFAYLPTQRSLTKILTEPPTWYLTINNARGEEKRIRFTTAELLNFNLFQIRVFEATNILPHKVKTDAWQNYIRQLTENIVEVQMPEELQTDVQIATYLEEYLQNSVEDDPEALLRNAPILYEDHYCFRLDNFMRFLKQRDFPTTRNTVSICLRNIPGVTYKQSFIVPNQPRVRYYQVPRDWNGGDVLKSFTVKQQQEPY